MNFLLVLSIILFFPGLFGICLYKPDYVLHEVASLMIGAGLLSFTFWCVLLLIYAKPIEDSRLKSNKYERVAEAYFFQRGSE